MPANELTASGMMSLARIQIAPLSPKTTRALVAKESKRQQQNREGDDASLEAMAVNRTALPLSSASSSTSSVTTSRQRHKQFVKDFERAWARFVQQNADAGTLPKGQRERHIEELQRDIRQMRQQKENSETELLKQLAYITQTSESIQYRMTKKIQALRQEAQTVQEIWQQRIQDLKDVDQLQEETLVWFHFLRLVDQQASHLPLSSNGDSNDINHELKPAVSAASTTGSKRHETTMETNHNDSSSKTNKKKVQPLRPSNRAILLVAADPNNNASAHDDALRTYRVDRALQTAHVAFLKKEIERQQKTIAVQKIAAQFLAQHNIWKILNPTSNHVKDDNNGEDNNNNMDDEEKEESSSQGEERSDEVGAASLSISSSQGVRRTSPSPKTTSTMQVSTSGGGGEMGAASPSTVARSSADKSPPRTQLVTVRRSAYPRPNHSDP